MRQSLVLALALVCASSARAAVPGGALLVHGIDHVGINVPDAGAAAEFFGVVVGTRIVSDAHPAPVSAEWKRRFRWHAATEIRRLVMLEAPDGSKIELFEYSAPQASRKQPREDAPGATHIALKGQNLEHSLEVIRRRGLRILNDPLTLPDGTRWFYFLTPWGSHLELVFPPAA